MGEVELAWAAGFFDGEGYTGYYWACRDGRHRTPGFVGHTTIAQTHPEVLERFQKAVGVGKVMGPYKGRTERNQPRWEYQTAIKGTLLIAKLLNPYLSSVKRAQFKRVVDAYQQHKASQGTRMSAAQRRWRKVRKDCQS